MAGVNLQRDAVLFAEVPQDGLLTGNGGVLPQRPDTAEGVPADEVVGVEFHHRGGDHVEEVLDAHIVVHSGAFGLFGHWISPFFFWYWT